MLIIKINPNFGENLYNSTGKSLFYLIFIVVVVTLGSSLVSNLLSDKKNKVITIILDILMCGLVLVVANNPSLLLHLGEWSFDFLFDILKSLES